MKKVILLSLFCLSFGICMSQQTDSTTKTLVPVQSLTGRIKPDTSSFPADTVKVDTVYIDNPLNVIKAGLNLPSAYGFAFIGYERVLHYMGSVLLKLEFLGTYNPLSSVSFIKDAYKNTAQIRGVGITPEFRYYGSEKYAPKGVFVGCYIPLQFAKVKAPQFLASGSAVYSISSTELSYSQVGLGFDAGYQKIFKNNITFEALLGIAIARGKFSPEFYTTKIVDPNTGKEYESKLILNDGSIGRGFYPRAEISVGYAF